MKRINFNLLIAVAIIFISVSCASQRTGILDVKFTNQLTQTDLDKIKKDLKTQNIDLNYDLLEFDDNGKLKRINASIDYNDGQVASFKSRELRSSDKPGFYRDFSNGLKLR
ncbi:MAG: hypothetical protein AAFQ94_19990 [Bacteroidota bacterium]